MLMGWAEQWKIKATLDIRRYAHALALSGYGCSLIRLSSRIYLSYIPDSNYSSAILCIRSLLLDI
jgi:hypothetical protein